MLSPRFSILLVFCLPFLFSGSLAHSGHPSWATVMWDVDPQDMGKPGIGKASWNYYLPYYYRLNQLWSWFEHLDPLGFVEALYEKSTELGLFLMVIYLWRTIRRGCREEKSQEKILSAAPETYCQNRSCKRCELLCQLKANPALMEIFLKHTKHRYLQEDLPRGRETAKSGEDGEENRDFSLHTSIPSSSGAAVN